MKIGILGWYYQNNAGDDRILECLTQKCIALGARQVEVFIAWDELNTRIEDINSCDFLLVGGGGLILRNTNRLVGLFKKVVIPWAFIGVSIDSVGDDNLKFINHISDYAKFIIVRDRFSFNVFSKMRTAGLYQAPDLTFLYPYENDLASKEDVVAVSLRPWKPNLFKQYTKNYHRFNKLTYKFPIIVRLFGLWDINKFTSLIKKHIKGSIKPFPLHINNKNGDNLLMQKHFNANTSLGFDIADLKQSEYLIGMRLHSLIFATQMGIPFIAVSYASKIDNYLEDIDMSKFLVSVSNYSALPKKIDQLKLDKTTISKKLLQITARNKSHINEAVDKAFNTYLV